MWGGCTQTPPLGFDYVAGYLVRNNWGFALNWYAQATMHGETDPKQIHFYMGKKEIIGIAINHHKLPVMGREDKALDKLVTIPLMEAIPILKKSGALKTFKESSDMEIYKNINAEHIVKEIEIARRLINA